ncbi:MAG: NAD+ synthase [Phycisphaerales bacterium]|nr:MAG: NAD+ synthase [Phycisphaerales bacterium]
MKVALAQINPTIGDFDGNAARIIGQIEDSKAAGAHLVVFPELAVFGYPPKDMLLRQDLIRANVAAAERIASHCNNIAAIVGFVRPDPSGRGKGIFNTAGFCKKGRISDCYAKMLLPTYGVFDESRHFSPGQSIQTVTVQAAEERVRVGLTICEDLWNDSQFEGRRVYGLDPVALNVEAGIQLLTNISASPFEAEKQRHREALFAKQMREHGVPLVHVNQVGGQDDLIFDGASVVVDGSGRVEARAKSFCEDLLIVDLDVPGSGRIEAYPERIAGIREALVLGIRDYVRRCGFQRVVLGLSGGIDSAVTAALAVEAIGKECVHGVAMPSRFSSVHSVNDAKELAQNLGISLAIIPIEGAHQAMEDAVRPHFGDSPAGIAEENIQARIRGNILMSLSNKFGWLLLTTGNKSELAVGYCTLYGDMCGGLAVLSDVPKTVVYELARHINSSADSPCIPASTIEKEPSAELREDQRDVDSLPPYDILDAILLRYVEQDMTAGEIVDAGFDRATVERVARMVDHNEYKRKQTPVGLKVTTRAFGTGRRMPIAARY